MEAGEGSGGRQAVSVRQSLDEASRLGFRGRIYVGAVVGIKHISSTLPMHTFVNLNSISQMAK